MHQTGPHPKESLQRSQMLFDGGPNPTKTDHPVDELEYCSSSLLYVTAKRYCERGKPDGYT
jgi:hypothetical protein